MSRIGKSTDKNIYQWLPRLGRLEGMSGTANGYQISFWSDKNVLEDSDNGCITIGYTMVV